MQHALQTKTIYFNFFIYTEKFNLLDLLKIAGMLL